MFFYAVVLNTVLINAKVCKYVRPKSRFGLLVFWCRSVAEYRDSLTYRILLIGRYKAIPLQAWTGPSGCRTLRLSEFLDSRQMKVLRLSVLGTDRLYPQEIPPVLIFVRSWVDVRAIVELEGLHHWKIPMILSKPRPSALYLSASTSCATTCHYKEIQVLYIQNLNGENAWLETTLIIMT